MSLIKTHFLDEDIVDAIVVKKTGLVGVAQHKQ